MRDLKNLLVTCVFLAIPGFVVSCGGGELDPELDPALDAERVAAKTGSCKGFCGKKSKSGCYCDADCALYGDCCSDKAKLCGGVQPASCTKNSNCFGATQYCRYAEGTCLTAMQGQCVPRPQLCPKNYAPVCGCDNKNYSNECTAGAAGVSVAAKGECKPQPPLPVKCTAIKGCSAGKFCSFKAGECKLQTFTLLEGVCADKPQACTMDYSPVCGCDDKTYSNECFAWSAGVSVAAKGECKPPTPTCTNGTVETVTGYAPAGGGKECETKTLYCVTKDWSKCPMLAPYPPNWCSGGTIVQGAPSYIKLSDGKFCKMPSTHCVTKDWSKCPMLSPYPPSWCSGGTIVNGAPSFVASSDGKECKMPSVHCLDKYAPACKP